MTEKVLPYDRNIIRQETGYWCGPASTQLVLNSRGIIVPEADLAREIGTTTSGTNFVGLIERVLDRVTPDAFYTSVDMPNYPPTSAQRDRLWANIVQSINAGYGVVMNWVAPPSNYPRGVKGSQSPAYRGGTIYHYVACMGYDDVERALWIADSGFSPFGYWVSFDQAARLIPPKAYCYADTTAVAPPSPAVSTPPVALLSQAMGDRVTLDRYAALLPAVMQALEECQCTTVDRVAMWMAQVGHESGGLLYLEEIADGSAYEGRPDLGNTQPGDGRRFKGRGPIQITGRHNYTKLSAWAHSRGLVPSPTFFVDQPGARQRYLRVYRRRLVLDCRPPTDQLALRRERPRRRDSRHQRWPQRPRRSTQPLEPLPRNGSGAAHPHRRGLAASPKRNARNQLGEHGNGISTGSTGRTHGHQHAPPTITTPSCTKTARPTCGTSPAPCRTNSRMPHTRSRCGCRGARSATTTCRSTTRTRMPPPSATRSTARHSLGSPT